ncbi:MAG: fluoride efflux transporter FluC [Gulosibacter sp.]|uniref:fluoride efflux transporter FluC n=1 Tax=Gulosibacter sp. TaxID=2817531 RepID=UPI003F8E69E0
MTPEIAIGVALFGGLGSALRYLLGELLKERRGWSNAAATLLINVLGSFGLGITVSFAIEGPLAAWLITGFFGGFTTFSAVNMDVVRLAQSGKGWQALWYSVGQLVVTTIFALAGALLFYAPVIA